MYPNRPNHSGVRFYCSSLIFLTVVSSLTTECNGYKPQNVNQDKLLMELSMVDDQSEYLDPFDMGSYDSVSKPMEESQLLPEAKESGNQQACEPCVDLESFLKPKLDSCEKEVKRCHRTLSLKQSLLAEQNESPLIKHLILALYKQLGLEQVEILENEALYIRMKAKVTAHGKSVLKEYISSKKPSAGLLTNVEQVLQELWQLREDSYSQHWLDYYLEIAKNAIYAINTTFGLEFLVPVMCFLPILLGAWLAYQNPSPIRVTFVCADFIFCISWYWHWQHMIRTVVAKRQADLLLHSDLPDECRTRPVGLSAFWTFTRNLVIEDPCQKYQQLLSVHPILEVSPTLALSETISRFILHPLGFFGHQVSVFFGAILKNLSFQHGIIVLVVVVFLSVVLLLVLSGYGWDFPFWMGGIRPSTRFQTAPLGQTADGEILQQSVALLKEVIKIQERQTLVQSLAHQGSRVQEIQHIRQTTTAVTSELICLDEVPQYAIASTSTPPNSPRSSSEASLRDKEEVEEENAEIEAEVEAVGSTQIPFHDKGEPHSPLP